MTIETVSAADADQADEPSPIAVQVAVATIARAEATMSANHPETAPDLRRLVDSFA